jgi:ribosomal protein S12 methylthiotransferase accessory factor
MEKEQHFSQHLPFAKTELKELAEHFREKTKRPGKNGSFGKDENIINKIFPKIIQKLEDFTGKAYALQGNPGNPLPEKWKTVFDYLHQKKLISEVNFHPIYNDDPKTILISIKSHENFKKMDTDGLLIDWGMFTYGSSLDLDDALSRALGEFLERYTLLVYKERKILQSSVKKLAKSKKCFLHLDSISVFSDSQKKWFPEFDYDDESRFGWLKSKSIFSGKEILIPAQAVFWNYNFTKNNYREPILLEPNTNGAGGYYTLTKAILGGLYELIQRDGFLIYWLNKLSPLQIDKNSIWDEEIRNFLNEAEDCGLEVIFLSTVTDLEIPSCICLVIDNSGISPKINIGGGCGLNWNEVLKRSFFEASMLCNLRRNNKKGLSLLDGPYHPFKDPSIGHEERSSLWGDEKMFDKIKFFISGEKVNLESLMKYQKSFSNSKLELAYLVKKFKLFKSKDYEIFYYQAKNKILDELGYSVVKVTVPALVPLYLNEKLASLGKKRLKEVPAKIGYEATDEFNPWPHPFP